MKLEEIIQVLDHIAILLEIKGENAFKIRAYQNGARILENIDQDLGTLISQNQLQRIEGMGTALVDKITTLWHDKPLTFYENLKETVPSELLELLEIPSLGGKKIHRLHRELGVNNISDLKTVCQNGQLAALKGFGSKTAKNLLSGINFYKSYNARHLWWTVTPIVEEIIQGLRKIPEVQCVEVAGSFRRKKETVGDLDFIVASEKPDPVIKWFTNLQSVQKVTAKGYTKSSIRLEGGLQADLRIVPKQQFATALHHFTGSKEHNVQMRQRALAQGLSLSEWGIFPKDQPEASRKSLPVKDEETLFKTLGLPWINPELREGNFEIALAESQGIPQLLEPEDIKGVFHNHTRASDGKNTLTEMVVAAQSHGWQYLGISDHSRSSVQARGLDEERLLKQIENIQAINQSKNYSCWIFSGSEVDILPDGRLDYPDELLQKLDYTVASVHSAFKQDKEQMTRRIIKAIENPFVTMIGHLTGRILLKREPYALNIEKVIDAAAANHTIIEINAHPKRLDMDWRYWIKAREKGIITSINPDAHDTKGLSLFRAGVDTARKAAIPPEKVLNTQSIEVVGKMLQLKRGKFV